MAKAIEVFEAILPTPDSPFARNLRGDGGAFTQIEKDGLNRTHGLFPQLRRPAVPELRAIEHRIQHCLTIP